MTITTIILFAVALLLLALALWKGSKRDRDVILSSQEWRVKRAAFYWHKR